MPSRGLTRFGGDAFIADAGIFLLKFYKMGTFKTRSHFLLKFEALQFSMGNQKRAPNSLMQKNAATYIIHKLSTT